jgi:hypothetical protein
MKITAQIAKLFRDVHYGGNWTWVDLKTTLADVTWQQATTQVHSFNTIAVLVYHMNYYVRIAINVLQGMPLDGHDKFSFDCPPIQSQKDWEQLVAKTWSDADTFATLLEQMPDEKLEDTFFQEKYGNYYRNMHGIIEHCHYHLGQIVLIKKILLEAGVPNNE